MIVKRIISSILLSITMIILTGFTKPNSNEISSFELEFETNQSLRAVWVTPIVGEVSTFTTEAAFKNQMNGMLDMLEHYNMNALIFHVRTHNNALYDSQINPKASWFSNVDFNNFDPLMWLIEETQSRGIEFHAWLNPYRYGTNYVGAMPAENPASNQNNILTNPNNSALRILNPGLPSVRDFIVDTVLEIIEKYPVDAIHFDDYFYTNLGANGALSGAATILDEPDQSTFVTYGSGYNTSSAASKADWRRHQVNLMIESVSSAIGDYNENNNKHVQFGISPTGIYKNGNGVVTYDGDGKPITTGSATSGQTHYSSYLFSDSLHWISEGWLDYIAPQSYWATNHSVASYYEVMGWWDKVVKHLPVNLYSGIGLYFADTDGTFNWRTDPLELQTQLNYSNTLESVDGTSIYSLQYITKHYQNVDAMSATQFDNAVELWNNIEVLPKLKSMEPIYLGSVSNIEHYNGTLTFNTLEGAKQYYVYRTTSELTYDGTEIIGVVGRSNDVSLQFETGDLSNEYQYGVRALSYTNHLGATSSADELIMIDGASIRMATEDKLQGLRFYANKPENIISDTHGFYIVYGSTTHHILEDAIENPVNNEIIVNGKKVFKVQVNDIESDGSYSVVLTGIPEVGYTQNITVFAYYEHNDNIHLSNNSTTRSILEIAIRIQNAGDEIPTSLNIINAVKDTAKHLSATAFNTYAITGIYETDHRILKDEFIKDWNNLYHTDWTELNALTFFNNAIMGKESGDATIRGSRIYEFFNHPELENKWHWFLDYLLSVDGTIWTTRQIHAIRGDGTFEAWDNLYLGRHAINSIYNFFYEAHEVGGYTAINFVINKHFYKTVVDFSDNILVNRSTYQFMNVGDTIKIPGPVPGYENGFMHFLINSVVYEPDDDYIVTMNIIIEPVYE